MARSILIAFLFFNYVGLFGQSIVQEDYQRAVSYLWGNLNNHKIFNANIQTIWFGDSTGIAFVTQNSNTKTFQKVSWQNKQISPLFDHEKFAKIFSISNGITIDHHNLPIQIVRIPNAETIYFAYNNMDYKLVLTDWSIEKLPTRINNPLESKSPDNKWIAYVDNFNLYIKSTVSGQIKQLSSKGELHFEYGSYYGWSDMMEGENGDRPKRLSIRWSPDSRWIQTFIVDLKKAEKMYLLDWSIDTLYKPKLLSYYRASPGDTNIVRMIPAFFNIQTGEEYVKSQLSSTHTNPVSYKWSKDKDIVYQENTFRGYQRIELHRCDLNLKSEELLYAETSKTNIDNYQSRMLEEIGKILITSEKDGWKQIYLLDIKTKKLSPITRGEYYVNDILHVNTKEETILFTASGKDSKMNPYFQQLYKAKFSGEIELLTPEDANHDISVSPDGRWYVDKISTMKNPTVTYLKDSENKIPVIQIAKTDILSFSTSEKLVYPEPFEAIARDSKTVIYGAIWKPTQFKESAKYPVIDQSYTGPHTYMYPRSFLSAFSRSNQALAELGFVVITVDGMGTANRSKDFHNVSYKNMGKNLEDHKLAILQLGRKYPWIDTTRVGIFGHSAGGYDAAHALLEYPDFYKVAVASSADHDFRMEKAWWPEMYMGWPVDSTYHEVSNITMAKNLKGKLLITHGGIDENVNPSATFKLAEALIRENKEFDMLIIPSQKHGYTGGYNDYFTKKKWNYFVQHLLGVTPIWDFKLK
jgi:dipeptidyl aminopeptidase/acylaminoacyl peptidase